MSVHLGMIQEAVLKSLASEGPITLAAIREFYREKAGGHGEYPKTMALVKLFIAQDLAAYALVGPDRGIEITERGRRYLQESQLTQQKLYIARETG